MTWSYATPSSGSRSLFPGYGYRRVTKQLDREGVVVNHKRVLRVMRQESLLCQLKKRFVATTDSAHSHRVYPNLMEALTLDGLDQAWVADISYIRLPAEFVYLAAILDAYSRRCIGWALSRFIDTRLTLSALRMAIEARRPSPGFVHHSDRGVQYASHEYVAELGRAGARVSMSRTCNPYDNAKAESFFKTLKGGGGVPQRLPDHRGGRSQCRPLHRGGVQSEAATLESGISTASRVRDRPHREVDLGTGPVNGVHSKISPQPQPATTSPTT